MGAPKPSVAFLLQGSVEKRAMYRFQATTRGKILCLGPHVAALVVCSSRNLYINWFLENGVRISLATPVGGLKIMHIQL